MKIVFKQQPLSFHKDAYPAAMASLAAHEQGKFWEYHDVLFANAKRLDRASLDQYAKDVGLNMKKFSKAMDTNKFDAQIKRDQAHGAKVGARGTPTSFVNGYVVKGAAGFSRFKTLIDQELAKAPAASTKKGSKKKRKKR